MNNLDDWSQIISKYLKSETDPLNLLSRHELQGDVARVAFIRAVLERFLPEIYGVGSGQIMDSNGNLSGSMDIIIYRRDFPRLDLPGSRDIYVYESVIATVEVVAKLVKKTFFEALNRCASLAELNPHIDPKVLTGLAVRNQLSLNEQRVFVHPDPIRTARFHLIGRPLSFIYGFSGFKTSPGYLAETLDEWISDRSDSHKPVEMKSVPSVIATQGCFAWRNSAPFTINNHSLMGVGTDHDPIRLIVLQILHTLSRRLKTTTDSFGLKPGLDAYLGHMPPPVVTLHVGNVKNPVAGEQAVEQTAAASQPATVAKPVMPKKTQAVKPEKKPAATVKKSEPEAKPAPTTEKVAEQPVFKETEKPVFEVRSRPAAIPEPKPAAESVPPITEKPAQKTLGSLNPKPEAVDAPFPVPNADLIPDLDPDPPESGENIETKSPAVKKQVASVTNINKQATRPVVNAPEKKTPVDIELETAMQFKTPPTAAVDSADASADAFIQTVKLQLSNSEPFPHLKPKSEPEPEPFTSTIPQ